MGTCESCREEKQLVNAIMDARIVRICSECALLNRAVVVERPSKEKLENLDKTFRVRERLEEASGFKEREKAKSMQQVAEDTAFPETISYRLRKEREKAGFTQDKLADEIGVPFEEVMRIEAGQIPSEKALRRYEQFFKKKFPLDSERGKKSSAPSQGPGAMSSGHGAQDGERGEGGGGITFRDEKVSLKELLGRAKTFFTSKGAGSAEPRAQGTEHGAQGADKTSDNK